MAEIIENKDLDAWLASQGHPRKSKPTPTLKSRQRYEPAPGMLPDGTLNVVGHIIKIPPAPGPLVGASLSAWFAYPDSSDKPNRRAALTAFYDLEQISFDWVGPPKPEVDAARIEKLCEKHWKQVCYRIQAGEVALRHIETGKSINELWEDIKDEEETYKMTEKSIAAYAGLYLTDARDVDKILQFPPSDPLWRKRRKVLQHKIETRLKGRGSAKTLIARRWSPSRPLLPYCAALAQLYREGDGDLLRWYILNGDWVPRLMRRAENLRPQIEEAFPDLKASFVHIELTILHPLHLG